MLYRVMFLPDLLAGDCLQPFLLPTLHSATALNTCLHCFGTFYTSSIPLRSIFSSFLSILHVQLASLQHLLCLPVWIISAEQSAIPAHPKIFLATFSPNSLRERWRTVSGTTGERHGFATSSLTRLSVNPITHVDKKLTPPAVTTASPVMGRDLGPEC